MKKYTFLHGLSFLGFLFLFYGFLLTSFQVVNKYIASSAEYRESYLNNDKINFGLACMFITLPLYYVTTFFIQKAVKKREISITNNEHYKIAYVSIAIVSTASLVILVNVVNSFFELENITKVLLKILIILLINFFVFSFYLYDISRKEVKKNDSVVRMLFILSLIFLLFVFFLAVQ